MTYTDAQRAEAVAAWGALTRPYTVALGNGHNESKSFHSPVTREKYISEWLGNVYGPEKEGAWEHHNYTSLVGHWEI